ncbi:unnamed protein product [Aspergillus oryzae var. brunneus]|uniref:proton-translocating NAD(P)(+) transhydrogenase n=1 Tax=Aspergillus oryzae var. brunneus TaxID=332754 RepID=A0ABQ6KMS7_ASPOZ|nr:unnamed protein product [Aspergillus oryzae]GMG46576.1 unnamed protein product [Aspergillus oryzae var. brunneus]
MLYPRLAADPGVVARRSASSSSSPSPVPVVPYSSLTVGVPRETYPNERRVAITPQNVALLLRKGFSRVLIERGAGEAAELLDQAYEQAGATLVDRATVWSQSNIILKVRGPQPGDEIEALQQGSTIISFLYPAQNKQLVDQLASRRVTAFAMDMVPRISRAQTFDALRCARRLGAIVRGFDTRPAVREQVQSLGAEFIEVDIQEDGAGQGGYAKEMSKEFIEAEMKLFMEQCREVDIIVTTALIPGKPAPKLITKESSTLYSNNITKYLLSMAPQEKSFGVDLSDEVVRGSIVTLNGEILPPAPRPAPPPTPKVEAAAPAKEQTELALTPWQKATRDVATVTAGMGTTLALGKATGPIFMGNMLTFGLAGLVGYRAVWGVAPALHSPLMSVTNAISGESSFFIVICIDTNEPALGMVGIGGFFIMGGGYLPSTIPEFLGAVSVLLAFVNVSGGFVVTKRMLDMFKRWCFCFQSKMLAAYNL